MIPSDVRTEPQIPPSLVAWLDASIRSHRTALGERRGSDMVLIMVRRFLAEAGQGHLIPRIESVWDELQAISSKPGSAIERRRTLQRVLAQSVQDRPYP